MTVTALVSDPRALTITITAEFAADPARVWELWADPRKLERWWGPPGYPATFVDHEMRAGSLTRYFMTTPEGERFWGWWRITAVDAPGRLEFDDGFGDDKGDPNPDLPAGHDTITIAPAGTNLTKMVMQSLFPSAEAMEMVIAMGFEEGIKEAMGQIDGILAEEEGTRH